MFGFDTTTRTDQGLNVGGAINALSLSPDGTHAVVAGREVLKVVKLDEEPFREVHNLRVGKANLNYSSVDAKWHPQEQHKSMIATAATNGAVVIWNINREGQKQEKLITEHTRTVNRIAWHPDHAYTLLSASQDGTMRLWDIRDPTNNKVTFDGKSESVRDVQFSLYSNYFAAAFDNGTIQIWDIRKHSSFEKKLTAHQGPVFCIDWHPEDKNLLASGGRDRLIQVWDLNIMTGKPLYSIQTVSSVSHINWRPNYKYHIASTGLMDPKIHVWDLRKPFIPVLSFVGHKDIASDIQWHRSSSQRIYSAGKDNMIIQQIVKNAYRPYEHIRTASLTWNPRGEIAIVNDKVNRTTQEEAQTSVVFPSFFAFGNTPAPIVNSEKIDSKVKRGAMSFYFPEDLFKGQTTTFNPLTCQYLAENYIMSDPSISFADTCDRNAECARHARQFQIAQTWLLLKLFFDNINQVDDTNSTETSMSTDTTPRRQLSKTSSKDVTLIQQMSSSSIDKDVLAEGGISPNPRSILEDSNLLADLNQSFSQLEFLDPLIPIDEEMTPFGSVGSSIGHDEGFLSSDVSFPLAPLPKRSTLEVPPLTKLDNSPRFSNTEWQKETITATPRNDNEPKIYGLLFSEELRWDPTPFIIQTLEFYAENGDVQTAVVMGLVLGDRITLDSRKFRHWMVSYIDLLQHLQLWTCANEVIKKSGDQNIGALNKTSTTVHSSCPHCNKPLLNLGWVCEHCKKTTGTCSLCHQRVKGLYVWCQGCGHGGHLNHLSEWFQTEKYCPSGCGHMCSFSKHYNIGPRKDTQ